MMSWTHEILRAFFVAFGALQTISNMTYLLKKNGLELARKQHNNIISHSLKYRNHALLLDK